jgi:hypothetical protein
VRLNEYRARVQLTRALTELVSGSIGDRQWHSCLVGECAVPCPCEDEYRAQESRCKRGSLGGLRYLGYCISQWQKHGWHRVIDRSLFGKSFRECFIVVVGGM